MNILDAYVMKEPTNQNVFDIFKGEWSSKIPDQFRIETKPGTAALFEDIRIQWAEDVFGKFDNLNILELGPLEGGHSYMLQNKNARKIVAIEANTRSFLKCLCVKEVFKLDRVKFLMGDFIPFLKNYGSTETNKYGKFDIAFASGVLYHMQDPVLLIKLLSEISDNVFLWTHYYDKETISHNNLLKPKFGAIETHSFDSLTYECSTQSYNDALGWVGFCGGSTPTSVWLTKKSILEALKLFGFTDIQIGFDDILHPNGPAFAVCASKSAKMK